MKKKKTRMPSEMQWNASQEFATENYMMPMGPAFNPYWSGMQPGMEVFGGPFAGPMPYMGYGIGPMPMDVLPMDVPYWGHFPQDPYGPPVNMMPFPPQRNFPGNGMGFNGRPPVMSKEEFEARKVDLMRKRELERRGDSRDLPKERESREVTSSSGVPSIKSKSKSTLPPPSYAEQLPGYHRSRLERSRSPRRHSRDRPERSRSPRRHSRDPELPRRHSRDPELPRRHSRDPGPPRASSKREAEYDRYNEDERPRHHEKEHRRHGHHHHEEDCYEHKSESLISKPPMRPGSTEPPPKFSSISDKDKRSVFSRISFPEREAAAAKKRKTVSSSSSLAVSDEFQEDHHKSRAAKAVAKKVSSSTSGGNVEERYQYNDEYDESSEDDDRHFKRRSSRYVAVEEERHSSRGSKEREKGSHSSHSHK